MPFITPFLIAVSVVVPSRDVSPSRFTIGRAEVKVFSALKRIFGPGEMFPPRYSPAALTKSKVMQVPTSMTRMSLPRLRV